MEPTDWDAIVVGCGFGGAVTAARLAERGMRVLVVERGPWWEPGGVGQPDAVRRPFPRGIAGARRLARNVRWGRGARTRELLVHPDGLFEWHAFAGADVLTASGVGGGSLVYTNIQQRPDDDFFDALPPELSARELDPYYGRVRAMLRPAPPPHPPPKAEAFADAAARSGLGAVWRPDLAIAWGRRPDVPERVTNAAGVTQGTCVNVGNCVVGCEHGAKTTLDQTYVPLALRHGARLRALCEVVALGRERGRYAVEWHDHVGGRRGRALAPRLVLAAGTLNTVRLLLAARDLLRTLPALSPALGWRFTTNGDVVSLLHRPRAGARADRGPTITAVVRGDAGHHARFVVGEAGLPLDGLGLPGRLRRRLAASVALLGMGGEHPGASLRLDGAGLRSSAGRHVDPALYDALEQAGARLARGYAARRRLLARPGTRGRLLSVHPLGGASLATSPRHGVVAHTGEAFGHPGLYVADGSLYPRAPGVSPSMTIAALAERQAELME